jgi:hypothetical protein
MNAPARQIDEKITNLIFAAFPIALGYFAGIVYLSEYLISFSISVNEIDISIPLVISYSFNVFSSKYFIFPTVTVFIILYTLHFIDYFSMLHESVKSIARYNWLFLMTFIISALIVSLFVKYVANVEAKAHARQIWDGNTSTVILKNSTSYNFALGARQKIMYDTCFKQNSFSYIFSSPDITYALCRNANGEALVFSQKSDGTLLPIRSLRP